MADTPDLPAAFPPPTSRMFSKWLIGWNTVAAWAAIFLCIYFAQGVTGIVIPSMVGLIWGIFAIYAGVGHMDLREIAKVMPTLPQGPDAGPPDGCDHHGGPQ